MSYAVSFNEEDFKDWQIRDYLNMIQFCLKDERKHLHFAEILCSLGLWMHPGNIQLLACMLIVYSESSSPSTCNQNIIEQYFNAIKSAKRDFQYYNVGFSYLMACGVEAGIENDYEYFRQAERVGLMQAKKYPDRQDGYLHVADAMIAQRREEDAIDYLRVLLENGPNRPREKDMIKKKLEGIESVTNDILPSIVLSRQKDKDCLESISITNHLQLIPAETIEDDYQRKDNSLKQNLIDHEIGGNTSGQTE